MATLYKVPDDRDFEDYFEPDPNGPSIPGYNGPDDQPLRFAALSRGSKFPDVQYRDANESDITNTWAGKGTVAYTVPSIGDLGNYNRPFGLTAPIDWDTGNHLRTRTQFTVRNNGTWDLYGFSTNFVDDTRRTHAGAILTNATNGLLLGNGNWLASPTAGGGNEYTVEFVQEGFDWGRVDYPDFSGTINYQSGNARGSFNDQTGSIQGLGTYALSGDCQFNGVLDQTPTTSNYSLRDKNAGLSRYNRGIVRVNIKRGGNTVLSFRVLFNNENRWLKTDDA
jgi:hypothetical protein